MSYISIRELQKLSAEKIARLSGATAIRSGERTVGLLIPVKKPDVKRLRATLAAAEDLAKTRDPKKDDKFLRAVGADATHWTDETIKALRAEQPKRPVRRRKA